MSRDDPPEETENPICILLFDTQICVDENGAVFVYTGASNDESDDGFRVVATARSVIGDYGRERDELHDEFRTALDSANELVDTLVSEKALLKQQLDLASSTRAEALVVVADQRNQIGDLRAEIEAVIAGFDMLAEKIGDQFLFEQSELIQRVRREIYDVLRESPRWREAARQRAARAVLHARRPDPNEGDV